MQNFSFFLKQFNRNLRQNLQAMTSLSARSSTPPSPDHRPPDKENETLKHAPATTSLAKHANEQICRVKAVDVNVSNKDAVTSVIGFLHTPQNYHREATEGKEKTAAILLSGANGGVVGPSSIYLSIADKLASLNRGIPILRLDYRYPARNKYCVSDVLAAMDYLRNGFAVSRFVLVGWSFGGAPVFTTAAQDERVVACATIASQTAETDGIRTIATKNMPLLLMHGTDDQRLGASCSESLNDKYKKFTRGGECELRLFERDDHSLSKNSLRAEEMLCDFIMAQAGEEIGEQEHSNVLERPLLGENERIEIMKEGGDYGDLQKEPK